MGIDIYMKWQSQTPAEAQAQFTGFDITGRNGYLREAYHGGPYATRHLVPEAFAKTGPVAIEARRLRERLIDAVLLATIRYATLYANDVTETLRGILGPGGEIEKARTGVDDEAILSRVTDDIRAKVAKQIETRALPDYVLSFVEFVELAEAQEKRTGEPVTIIASY